MKTRNLDPRRLIGHAIHDGQEVVLVADEVDLVRLDVDRQRVAFRAGVDSRRRLRREIDDGRIRARAGRHVQLVRDGIERRQTAAIGLERVDDRVGVRIDDRDGPGPAVHRVHPAAARIHGEILDVGAGLERDHRPRRAVDDLDDAKIGKRRIRFAVARVDDHALGSVGDADLRADRGGQTEERGQCDGRSSRGSMSRHWYAANLTGDRLRCSNPSYPAIPCRAATPSRTSEGAGVFHARRRARSLPVRTAGDACVRRRRGGRRLRVCRDQRLGRAERRESAGCTGRDLAERHAAHGGAAPGVRAVHGGRRRLARIPRLRVRHQRVAVVHRVHGGREVQRQQLAVHAGPRERR